jgi:hypothetical protein
MPMISAAFTTAGNPYNVYNVIRASDDRRDAADGVKGRDRAECQHSED